VCIFCCSTFHFIFILLVDKWVIINYIVVRKKNCLRKEISNLYFECGACFTVDYCLEKKIYFKKYILVNHEK